MKHEFDISLFREGKADEILNKFPLSDRAKTFIKDYFDKIENSPKWLIDGRIIYAIVTSNGLTGLDLFRLLSNSSITVDQKVEAMLLSGDYVATNNVTTIVAIVNGKLFQDRYRTTNRVRSFAKDNRLYPVNTDVAISLRLKFTNESIFKMGVQKIVVMHESIRGGDKISRLINVSTIQGRKYLTARSDNNNHLWSHDTGFAFEVFRVKR